MGYSTAVEFASLDISLEDSVRYHLTGNFYPSIPTSMVPVCVRAIKAYNKGNYDANIKLPEGVLFRDKKTAPAWKIIEAHKLEPWCQEN